MRGIRCQLCGNMFTPSRDLVTMALEEVEEKGQDHFNVECPKCRRNMKVPRRDLERMRPRE